jgi:hypothetical protein
MMVNVRQSKGRHAVAARAVPMVLALGAVLALGLPRAARAQTLSPQPLCGLEIKEKVATVLSSVVDAPDDHKVAVEVNLYAQYEACAQDAQLAPASFHEAARQCGAKVSALGSLFFEEMSCCGYDPQRRQFACPVTISQPFGFGGAPLPGSREHVFHCVEDAGGVLVPVGHDSVHLANALGAQGPPWQFAVIANAHENLSTVSPLTGQTRRARSILSWGFTPTHCEFQPIWGNALDYRIRLDQ